ncbi:MAG: DUF1186 domain-containing protein [Candidatus Electrothrix aestuarii]|uniref:DUF1186 domain-containing protein n=1 Tax=Candidatus Electrothrix aestuarii TaxID=3062594 RepID=A0AAU8LVV9_9BACT|nr:DUF1186 domain-containing protein [Candidatus Electrothrix aestuarii]
MEINDLLKSLETYDKTYKRDEIDEALIKREAITPHLISVLEQVLQDPEKYADRDSDYWGHIYAFMLLGHFCETKAHDVIVDLFSLPNDLPSNLFGDSVTGDLPIVLLRTCGGNTERIRDLIVNKSAYDYCRGSALQALSYALIEGYITREEIVSFYRELFSEEETFPGSAFHDILANCICDIYPEELMEIIEKAYDEGVIHSGYIGYEDFTEVLRGGKQKCLDRLKCKMQKSQLDSIHDSMSWWACFSQPQESLPEKVPTKVLKNKPKMSKKAMKAMKQRVKASRKASKRKKK